MNPWRFASLIILLAAVPLTRAQQAPADLTVSLPLKELKTLLIPAQVERAPVDHAFGPAGYALEVTDKTASLNIDTVVSFPNRQWVLLPLGKLIGATSVTVDGKPAALTRRDDVLYAIIDARQIESAKINLTAQLAVRNQGEVSWITLPLIPSQMGALKATINAKNIALKAPDLLATKIEANDNATTLTATLPSAEAVRLQWSPRDARPARLTVQHLNHVIIDRGLIRNIATLQYDILRSPVETLAIAMPDGVEITRVTGDAVGDYTLDEAAKPRLLKIELKEPTQGSTRITVEYERRLKDDQLAPAVAMLTPMDVAGESGFVGVEVRGNYEVAPAAEHADRIDVAQLPDLLWTNARSPIRYGYRFDKPGVAITLTLRPLADMEVLIAMSDACEVATTITPEGKVITKMIMIVRNNQKSHLRLTLPAGAQLWSAFVDDRPVTPAADQNGQVLVPLRKSEAVDTDDTDNYVNRRNDRRNAGPQQQIARQQQQLRAQQMQEDTNDVSDLKPYDIELVYITPDVKLDDRGSLALSLPKVDIPIGRLAWAVFLPRQLRVVDTTGNMREVDGFSLPFRHFGEAMLAQAQDKMEKAMAMQDAQQAMVDADLSAVSARVKGVLPVRIEIPIAGMIHRFEKMLVVNEAPAIELTYLRRD